MKKIILSLFLLLLTSASLVGAHGVTYKIAEQESVAVQFGYAGGDPMSYATTKVFGPESSEDMEFQNGRTDALGRFAFVPNQTGEWRVVTTDNLGHMGIMEVVIEQSEVGLKVGSQSKLVEDQSMVLNLMFGLSILANLAFIAGFIKRPKRS